MKKIILGIGLILISGTSFAQGFTPGTEDLLFPSWWKVQDERNIAKLKDIEDNIKKVEMKFATASEEAREELDDCLGENRYKKWLRIFNVEGEISKDEAEFCNNDYKTAINNAKLTKDKGITGYNTEKKGILTTIKAEDAKTKGVQVQGVIGRNEDQKLLLNYIPRIINILLKFVAPIVLSMFVFAGIRLIYAGSNEEDIEKSKNFFTYALLGVLFIVVSYSLMKALYFIFATS